MKTTLLTAVKAASTIICNGFKTDAVEAISNHMSNTIRIDDGSDMALYLYDQPIEIDQNGRCVCIFMNGADDEVSVTIEFQVSIPMREIDLIKNQPQPVTISAQKSGPAITSEPVESDYLVTWIADIFDAISPEDAAAKALAIQRNPNSIATVFQVQKKGETLSVEIDLSPEDPEVPEDLSDLEDLRPITFSAGLKSISDDDLCSDCVNCKFQPCDLSSCSENWPGLENKDAYVKTCTSFKATQV